MNDNEIIKLYFLRDQSAVTQTDKAYGSMCRALAKRILRSREDAEECVNDSYYKVWDSIPPEKPASLGAYLAKIVRNTSLDRLRELGAMKRGSGAVTASLDELQSVCGGGDGPEDLLAAKELGQAVDRFLRTQPEKSRNVFLRRYFYFESRGEIAQRCHLSPAQVSVTLTRVRKRLKAYLTKEGLL